jgi:hypothetical protein
LGAAWRQLAFDDSAWASGRGVFALENTALPAPTNTILRLTNSAGGRITNFYFRAHFTSPANHENLALVVSNLIDDGAIFYLNGTEVFRYNVPTGAITATTFADDVVEADSFVNFTISGDVLQPGNNVLAVEVHQATFDSSDVVFGASIVAVARQRGNTDIAAPVDVWAKVGYQGEANRGHIYYTTNGSTPEGAFGVGHGTTRVGPLAFAGADVDDGSIEWWRGTIPAQSTGTTVKYKLALFDDEAAPIESYKETARYGLTQFAITNWSHVNSRVWLHNNLNTNDTQVGLEEGFHMIRARAFIPRPGKSSVYNTFLQTFYYDRAIPNGVIAFPAGGDVLRSTEYGVVVRADETVTEVEYNVIDSNPNNDDASTGFNNGNGLTNGVPVFARATLIAPLASLSQLYPDYPQEFRFTYEAVPSSGSATITVRLKELATSIDPTRVRTLTRSVGTLAPPQTLSFLAPASNGQNISVSNNAPYTVIVCFSDTLTAAPDLFTIRIDGIVQPRTNELGAPLYRIEGGSCGSGRRDLRFSWTGMSSGQHYLEALYSGDGLSLQASRLVRVTVLGVVDTDGDGLPDNWENQNQFDPNESSGANGPEGDADSDQFSNIAEYLAGTDPRDPDSLLEIITQTDGGRQLTWKSVPGKSYRVYATANVTESFEPISTAIPATTTTMAFMDFGSVGAHKFYRVEVVP